MFDVCLSPDVADWFYEQTSHDRRYVDEKDHVCCECDGVIAAGERHDIFVGRRPDSEGGDTDVMHTCLACQRIWDSLAGGEKMFGGLDELLCDAYQLGLDEVPDGLDSDPDTDRDGCCLQTCEFLTVKGGEAWCSGWDVSLVCPARKATACGPCKAGEAPPIQTQCT